MKYIITWMLIFVMPFTAYADKIFLVKKGTTVTPTEDWQCMNNDTAKKLIKKIKLCESECEIKLNSLRDLKNADIKLLEDKLAVRKEEHKAIVREKDKAFNELELECQEQVEEASKGNGLWWKVTLGVVGGVLIGGLTTGLVLTLKD